MKRSRAIASLFPVVTGIILALWGLKVMYTSFTSGSMPIAGWHTDDDHKNLFGLTWFIAFSIVLSPVYLYAISLGLEVFKKKERGDSAARAKPMGDCIWRGDVALPPDVLRARGGDGLVSQSYAHSV